MLRFQAGARFSLTLLVLAVAPGCRHEAKTPQAAYQRFTAAIHAGNGAALFDALDRQTRWDLMTIKKYQREAYDIVLSNYPAGPLRDREKGRFERGATATSARDLFKTDVAPGLVATYTPIVQGIAKIEPGQREGQVTAVLPGGGRVPLARDDSGGWGFAGLDKQAEDDKNRAYHDLDVVRASAADYERAAARAAK